MTKRKYKKDVTLDYKYDDSPESKVVLEEVFDKVFADLIQKQKRLREYFASEVYKRNYEILCKRKSILADYLSVH